MRIGTINMQGQPIAQIDRMRFHTQLKKEIIELIIDKQIRGLIRCLEKYSIDIMACQEVNYSFRDRYIYELEKAGYELLYNKVQYNKTVFTVVGFIIKKELKDELLENGNFEGIKWTNKYYQIQFKNHDLSFVTVHVNTKDRKTCMSVIDSIGDAKNTVLIGDFNAASKNHRGMPSKAEVIAENTDFLNFIFRKKYYEIGESTNYTYITSNCKNKIDHIFISERLKEFMKEKAVEIKEYLVEECEHSQKDGFTDHNMLWFDIDLKLFELKNF